ncbi:MAG: hypothetical protein ACOYNI_04560 [Acidimicrobiia bacterium]
MTTLTDATADPEPAPAVEPSRRRAGAPMRWAQIAVMGAVTAFVIWRLAPGEIFRNTVPTGGDLGAHVWGPAYLRDHLLPLRFSGWAPDWFAGFPAYRFYMVLPALAVVVLNVLLPYGVALKMVVASGVVALPWCAWGCVRLMGTRAPAPECAAIATLPFLFDTSFAIYGGNLGSTLAGEYAYGISLCFALLAIGVAARGLATGRHRAALALLLAGCALSHVIPAFFAAAGVLVMLAFRPDRTRVRWLVPVVATAVALTAFWLLPFVGNHAGFNDMGWVKRTDIGAALLTGPMRLALPLAGIAVLGAAIDRRRPALQLAALAAVVALAFVLLPEAALWNARLLPFWYVTVWILAGIGVATAANWLAELVNVEVGPRFAHWVGPAVVTAMAFIVLVAVARPLGALPAWAPFAPSVASQSWLAYGPQGSFAGYERSPGYPQYRTFIDTMDKVGREHGCGRAMWEFSQDLGRYGTTMAPMLLPYWTDGCIGSMEGLYFESSKTTPYHFLNQARLSAQPSSPQRDLPYQALDVEVGVGQLQLEGVKYYLASSPAARAAADSNSKLRYLTSIEENGAPVWNVYEVADSDPVIALTTLPAVYEGPGSYRSAAMQWFQAPADWKVPLAEAGPGNWPRTKTTQGPSVPVDAPTVTNVRTGRGEIAFRVDRTGTPILVRTSAANGWHVQGARGPWTVAPNMMVVVPTHKNVTLRFESTALDLVGSTITIGGLAGVAWFALAPVPVLARRRTWWRDDEDEEQP